ncbi:protein rep [Shewanella chilikensis]|uniref:protein rep n=1 Tax=Shewanella chilikensis TaxID=558541 RepID=UPI003007597A
MVDKKVIQSVIDNREYNKVIVKYYQRYLKELEGRRKIYKDFSYLVDTLGFALSNKDKDQVKILRPAVEGMFKNLDVSLEYLRLDEGYSINFNNLGDVLKLQEKVKFVLSGLNDLKLNVIANRIDALESCNKFWVLDKYELQKIKDLKKQNLCHDKFCANCKKVKQSARMGKYIPELEKYKDQLYHLTLTVPNCSGKDLRSTIKKMNEARRHLMRFLNGTKRIKGIDLSSWGYLGAVCSLEITFRGDSYHPHFHVGLVMDQSVLSAKRYKNTYSYNYKNGISELKRLFSKEELLIQKIWRLLYDGVKVTEKNIKNLKEGYSCIIDQFHEDDYAELFKYMTKEKDEEGQILTYENFKALYEGLYRLKQIQGYGCLYRITDDIDVEEYEEAYNMIIEFIRKKESPVEVLETPQELFLDTQYKIISRKSYFKYLRSLYHG